MTCSGGGSSSRSVRAEGLCGSESSRARRDRRLRQRDRLRAEVAKRDVAITGLRAKRDRLREALEEAQAVRGTGHCKQPNCESCEYERTEATRVISSALAGKRP